MTHLSSIVTVDGPSGAGKGTLSQLLAKRLGFHLLDSGALYRLVALACQKQQVALDDEASVSQVARTLDVVFDTQGDAVQVTLSGENVSAQIRTEAISMGASVVAAYTCVREALLTRQRAFAQAPGLIADGRDMGTAVFPDAPVKFFLTASAAARAERRFKQLQEKGEVVDLTQLIADIEERDDRDRTRAVSPLIPAPDAMIIDSTLLSIEQVLTMMLEHIAEKAIS